MAVTSADRSTPSEIPSPQPRLISQLLGCIEGGAGNVDAKEAPCAAVKVGEVNLPRATHAAFKVQRKKKQAVE